MSWVDDYGWHVRWTDHQGRYVHTGAFDTLADAVNEAIEMTMPTDSAKPLVYFGAIR